MDSRERPFRPIPGILKPARAGVRRLRVLRLRLSGARRVTFGRNFSIGARARLLAPQLACFGDDVSIGSEFHLESNLVVGDGVLISSRVAIVGSDHVIDDPNHSVYWAGRRPPPTVVLEGDNLIGFGTTIVGPVRIGRGCVVGAGAVVTRDLPANSVCAGVPARVLRPRFAESEALDSRDSRQPVADEAIQ